MNFFISRCQILKESLFRRSLRTKLLFWSFVLSAAVAASMYFLSQNVMTRFILQRQTDYHLNSFRQAGSYFKSYFEYMEGNINRVFYNSNVTEYFQKAYSPSDLQEINRRLNLLNREISSTFFQYVYVDSLIILGENNFSYIYTPFDSGRYVSVDFSYTDFQRSGGRILYSLGEEGSPFFFKRDSSHESSGITENRILNTIDNKIVLVRSIPKANGSPGITVIATFNPSFIADILPDIADTQAVYLIDGSNSVIWSKGNNPSGFSPQSLPAVETYTKYTVERQDGKDVLYTYNLLHPYNFILVISTPVQWAMRGADIPGRYTLLYGTFCIMLVLAISYFFSRRVTAPLHVLAERLSADTPIISSQQDKPHIEFPSNHGHSLRLRIFTYFAVTIILPSLLLFSLLFVSFYKAYGSKVMEFTANTIEQVKRNIDYKIVNYSEITRDTIYSSPVQDLLNGAPLQESTASMDALFANVKSTRKDVLSMKLFRKDRQLVYTSITFDTAPAEKTDKDFFSIMDKSTGNLVFLGLRKDYSMNSVLVFARKVKSQSSSNFSQEIGYALFHIDPDSLQGIYEEIRPGDSGFFFMTEETGAIFGYSNQALTLPIVNSDIRFRKLGAKSRDSFSIRYSGKDYIVLYDTTHNFSLKIAGIIPYNEISSLLYPLILYGLLFLFAYSVLTLALSSLIAFSITRPLKKLEDLMEDVSLRQNLDVRMNYRGNDEIAILSAQFNLMLSRLNELIHENYQARLRESELQFLEKEAQLNALQQQINPHFLYNTLESIKWMAYRKGAMEICDMATSLGEFFRGSIAGSKDMVTVAEEIEHLKNYLHIQELRYQGKFIVSWDVDPEILPCKTIKFILQPIVENSIVHGLDSMEEGGCLTIRVYRTAENICIDISDNGTGMDGDRLAALRSSLESEGKEHGRRSIGLRNVYRRLKLFFDGRFSFEITSSLGAGTEVSITMPLS